MIYAGPYERKQCDEPPNATIRATPENLEPDLPDESYVRMLTLYGGGRFLAGSSTELCIIEIQ